MDMKSALTFITLLCISATAQAQHRCGSAGSGFGRGNGGGPVNGGYTNNYGYGELGAWGDLGSVDFTASIPYEPPRDYALSYETNDGLYMPSTYMDYDKLVELGRKQLAAAKRVNARTALPPLGDIARAYRAAKVAPQELEPRFLVGTAGEVQVCYLTEYRCHRPD